LSKKRLAAPQKKIIGLPNTNDLSPRKRLYKLREFISNPRKASDGTYGR
jgi:hypothetical protein